MTKTLEIEYSCGHRKAYQTAAPLDGQLHSVPFSCPPCTVEQESLACTVCGNQHPKQDSLITAKGDSRGIHCQPAFAA